MENKNILTTPDTKVKVSSTIQGNSSEYSKKNILDNNPESFWYSNQGKFQYVCLFFNESVSINEIHITFSGGFCPKEIELSFSEEDQFENKKPTLTKGESFEVENSNNEQKFVLQQPIQKCRTLKLFMKQFYDLYGRIMVYDLKVLGTKNI